MRPVRICVAVPPIRDFYFTPHRSSALGGVAVAALLEKAGHAVSFFNFPLSRKKSTTLPLPADLGHLKEIIIPDESGPVSFFTRYQHFGPPFAECARQIVAADPELLLLSSFAFAYADQTLSLAAAVKQLRPGLTIAAGGAGVSVFPDYYLGDNAERIASVDFALVGEAEVALVQFINGFVRGGRDYADIPNLHVRGKTPRVQENLTHSSDLEFIWNRTLETRKRIHIATSLSRGCPKHCRFCSNHLTHGQTFRTVPLERVAAGITGFPRHKPISLNFEDDNLLLAKKYWLELLELCRNSFPDISFSAENGLDYTLLDEGLADKLVDLGMRQFNLSLGAIDAGILKAEKRYADLARLEGIIGKLAARKVPVITYFICGLQEDTPEKAIETLLYLAQLPTLVGISPFYPVPGLPGFTDRALFRDRPSALCAGSAAWPWTKSLTSAQLVTAFRLARLVNLCKKKDRLPAEQEIVDQCAREKRLYTLIGKEKRCVPVQGIDEEMVENFFARASRCGFSPVDT